LLIFSGRIGSAPIPHFAGKIDRADCTTITGWVWDKNDLNAEVQVELWDSERRVITVPANEFRQDLVDAGYGNGRHAFRIPTPQEFRDGRSHSVHLRVAGDKRDLADTARIIVCP
jgi:hypothetical protein